MNNEFLISEERLDIIAKNFSISRESVGLLHKEFCSIENQVKKQRLAHISRVLEIYFKAQTGNPEFVIEYVPYGVQTPRRRGSMSIYRSWYKKFTVFYDNTLPEREIRVNISHELGHLYLFARLCGSGGSEDAKRRYEETTEPLSSIFGLFVVSNKNHFYNNLDYDEHKHDDWDNVLKDFMKFCT